MLDMRVDDDQVIFFNRKTLVFDQEFPASLTDIKEFRECMGMWDTGPVFLIVGRRGVHQGSFR